MGYDSSNTFPVLKTLPPVSPKTVGYKVSTEYYGVDNSATGGLYGQAKSVSELHGEETSYPVTTYTYDGFGRKTRETKPNGAWTSLSYNNFGIFNPQPFSTSQNVRMDSSEGSWTADYLDGFGRSVRKLRSGPDGKTIAADTEYDGRGSVTRASVPYFQGDTPRYNQYLYDVIGRVLDTISPDPNTHTQTCYDEGVAVTIDANSHRKRETKDVNGRLVKVQEYLGIYPSCTTETLNPYATTEYVYDVIGNITDVKDHKQNHTVVTYDTLGRKKGMTDPDMGSWSYGYDSVGNLTSQKDAKLQTVIFKYDEMNRLTSKIYPNGTNVAFYYDEATYTYPIGRLTRMIDESGLKTYDYDEIGRVLWATKTVDGQSYKVGTTYDGLDRIKTVSYPGSDNETVTTVYDLGGNVWTVTGRTYNNSHVLTGTTMYGTYTGFDALGHPGSVKFGNNVVTTYEYNSTNKNKWLSSIVTKLQDDNQTRVVDLGFDYYDNRNVKSVTDNLPQKLPDTISQSFSIYYGKAHTYGVTGTGFIFDENGNFKSDWKRTATFNYDNMPATITALTGSTSFVYDGNGQRVKKNCNGISTVYIDNLYECRIVSGAQSCGKYIFAGSSRIVLKNGIDTYYYHTDHLGSTVAVTKASGDRSDSITYSAFGETTETPVPPNTGVTHKFTGQELDSETSLYNYGARLYDPDMGRFISPDTIVQNYSDPQTLNRYSYARNNPLLYSDPTGHFIWVDDAIAAVVGAAVGGISAAIEGGNIWQGMAIGAVSAVVGYETFGLASGAIESLTGSSFLGGAAGGAMGGAVGGATAGGLTAAAYGQDVGQGMLRGAQRGAIGGGITGGLISLGVPNALAAFGGGYAAGGEKGGWYGALSVGLGSVLSMATSYGTDDVVPEKGTPEYNNFKSQNRSYVAKPAYNDWSDIFWNMIALLGNGYSHTGHTQDATLDMSGRSIMYMDTVDYPGEAYRQPGKYNLFTNNCTTRFGLSVWNPSQYAATVLTPFLNYNYRRR